MLERVELLCVIDRKMHEKCGVCEKNENPAVECVRYIIVPQDNNLFRLLSSFRRILHGLYVGIGVLSSRTKRNRLV